MDIARDGIAIYQSDDSELAEPEPKTPADAFAMAKEYFSEWFSSGNSFFKGYRFYVQEADTRRAVFLLHQAAENLYDCVLLICTNYAPHTPRAWLPADAG